MRLLGISALALALGLSTAALAAEKPADAAKPAEAAKAAPSALFEPDEVSSEGSVTVHGARIDYKAVAGTLVVHAKGWDDAAKPKAEAVGDEAPAEASMFYTAYFKKGAPAADRPLLFVFNGGPGSSTVWLHMGAFGPRRVVTADGSHTPPAPYRAVDNGESPLDVADLVFIDAPGAGFSRIAGKDKEKAFYGIDQDVYAFAEFIKQFLAKYQRWNSPRYLFGESYGTPRAVALAARLQNADSVDLNGIMLLSTTLAFDFWADAPQWNPGNDLPYIVTLPTYAATAWYHNRVPGGRPAALEPFLAEAERFATGDYAAALIEGNDLPATRKQEIAEKLARYTGLTPAYILRSNLRVNLGQFNRNLMDETGQTVGRLDTRFAGPSLDVLSKEADYDPQSTAISSAYVSAFNDYARGTLRFGAGKAFKLFANVGEWDLKHTPPGAGYAVEGAANVLPDLAFALKTNPSLRVLVLGGYYDTATPYFEGRFQMRHLPVPESLRANISYKYYPSGHMVYAHEDSLKALHDDVAAFVKGRGN
ncbi:S10 family peptidase [Novosphingobium sp.]|uniref:S10 family peptidase n=1 Tax=Novosphingobium sp. TaxID=1874826 RepID=UPI003BAD0B63